MIITVAQHIYSNVPKEQSPSNRRGYQTLFYTHAGLSDDEVTVLEDRAQYYAASTEPTKYQFFMLPTKKAVVSQIVPLPEPDEFGRKGRYLAHGLIISARDFQAMEYCPLSILTQPNIFIRTVEDAFRQSNRSSGDIVPKQVQTSNAWSDFALKAAHSWPLEQVLRLARLGWQAEHLKSERQSVGFVGDTNAILVCLAVAFLLTAPQKRSLLTFDTFAHGCDWSRDWPFWAWGAPPDEPPESTYRVTTAPLNVSANLSAEHDTPFEHWVAQRALPARLETYLPDQEQALRLERFISGQKSASNNLAGIDDQFARDFCQLNSSLVEQRLLAELPDGLSAQISKNLATDMHTDPWGYLKWLQADPLQPRLADLFFHMLLKQPDLSISGSDRKALAGLAAETRHSGLEGLLKLNDRDLTGWKKTLPKLPKEIYQALLQNLSTKSLVSASDAFTPARLPEWCAVSGPWLKPGEVRKVLDRISDHRPPLQIDALSMILEYLNKEDTQYLVRWLKSYRGSAPELRATLLTNQPQPEKTFSQKLKDFVLGEPEPQNSKEQKRKK